MALLIRNAPQPESRVSSLRSQLRSRLPWRLYARAAAKTDDGASEQSAQRLNGETERGRQHRNRSGTPE